MRKIFQKDDTIKHMYIGSSVWPPGLSQYMRVISVLHLGLEDHLPVSHLMLY